MGITSLEAERAMLPEKEKGNKDKRTGAGGGGGGKRGGLQVGA